MPPFTSWFRGREAVTRFLAARAFGAPGTARMIPIGANGQPAAAHYRRGEDGVYRAHALHVLTDDTRGDVASITVFLDEELFSAFGLPATVTSLSETPR